MMNDSGFESPSKIEQKVVKFTLKSAKGKRPEQVLGDENQTLVSALTRRFPKMNIEQRLFWAKIKGSQELVSINPFTFLCGWLEPQSCVEWEASEAKIYKPESPETENLDFFLIENWNKKYMESMTNLHYDKFRAKNWCVVAKPGESLFDALENDGRFKSVNRFELYESDNSPKTALFETASNFSKYMFKVAVKKQLQQTIDSSPLSSKLHPSDTNTKMYECDTALGSVPISCASTVVLKADPSSTDGHASVAGDHQPQEVCSLVTTLVKSGGIYVFSKSIHELSNKEMMQEMHECAKASARSTLVPPDKQDNYEKEVVKLAVQQFANQQSAARPAKFTKELGHGGFIDSVGRIMCGSVTATCFLISKNLVITCCHVVDMIINARYSDAKNHQKIYVDFDYENPGQLCDISRMVQVFPLLDEKLYSSSVDYAFLHLKKDLDDKVPLGPIVKCHVPEKGLVAIIGHPDKQEKLEETCVILPRIKRQEEIGQRWAKKQERCEANPMECALNVRNDDNVKCVHLYRIDVCNDNRMLTYDVEKMFQGSSGSPVFDVMSTYIVAMHSAGYTLHESKRKTSLFEYGPSFSAIIEDLKNRGKGEMVRAIFPNCEMDVYDMDLSE